MTHTTTSPNPATTPSLRPVDILMNLIATLLAPMFLGVTGGNVALARMAAIETINAYRAQNLADLIAIAQIIAYGLAALGSLSLSMADDLSLSMTLRLRGNANACTRSAEQNRRALSECFSDNPIPYRSDMAAEPEIPAAPARDDDQPGTGAFLDDAAAEMLAAESMARLRPPEKTKRTIPAPVAAPATAPTALDRRHLEMWAIAMVKESGEITDSIPHLPAAERKSAQIRAAELTSKAHDLLTGAGSRTASLGAPFPGQPESTLGSRSPGQAA
jgi:hypothetical protein